MSEPVYRIKRLVWTQIGKTWVAETIAGHVYIYHHEMGFDWDANNWDECGEDLPTLEAAQAAAQAWHDERMRSGLEVV